LDTPTRPGEKVEELCSLLNGQLSGPHGLLVAEYTWFRLEFDANKGVYIVELGFGEFEEADATVGSGDLDDVMDQALAAARRPNPRFRDKDHPDEHLTLERVYPKESLLAQEDRQFIQEVRGLIGDTTSGT
jgi:hypothetical protein